MNSITDTGGLSIDELLERERRETPRRCELCQVVDLTMNMVFISLGEIPSRFSGYYHLRCADEVKERYQKVCVACGVKYAMRREDGNVELCMKCDKGEYRRLFNIVRMQNYYANRLKLPATLTMKEWLATLEYFGWSCAYCVRGPFDLLEHFMPLSRGGGTTKDNCVPACYGCNTIKSNKNPFYSDVGNLYKVSRYLKGRG
jgi:HNH endonuclease